MQILIILRSAVRLGVRPKLVWTNQPRPSHTRRRCCTRSSAVTGRKTKMVWLQSVSQWNAGPATGRSALQDLRSCAVLQASLAFSPVSSSICCTHVRQGRPRWRFHSVLMSSLPPVRASTARRSAEWAGVASGSRHTWPEMESRLRQIRIAKPSSPVCLVTEAFVTKWQIWRSINLTVVVISK